MRVRKLSRREIVLVALLAAAGGVLLWGLASPESAPAALGGGGSRPEAALPPIPRIDLERLDHRPAVENVGRRDLFAYGAARARDDGQDDTDVAVAPPPPVTAPPPVTDIGTQVAAARLPPLNLHFIGAVGNAKGVKVAVLLTDRNEVLTGQQGDVVANRYRIEKIGIESVDLADVGTGQSRRIPLKGN